MYVQYVCKVLSGKKKGGPMAVGLSYLFEKVAMDTVHVTLASGRKEYFLVAVY